MATGTRVAPPARIIYFKKKKVTRITRAARNRTLAAAFAIRQSSVGTGERWIKSTRKATGSYFTKSRRAPVSTTTAKKKKCRRRRVKSDEKCTSVPKYNHLLDFIYHI